MMSGKAEIDSEMISDIAKIFGIATDDIDKFVNESVFVVPSKPKKVVKKDKVHFDPNIKFSYYGDVSDCKNHGGIITIASIVDDENKTVIYGVSYCSPKDTYDKILGKLIAVDDLNAYRNTVTLRGKRHNLINGRIMCDIIANADAPSWAEPIIVDSMIDHLDHVYFFGG
jgi:hypothetical protein